MSGNKTLRVALLAGTAVLAVGVAIVFVVRAQGVAGDEGAGATPRAAARPAAPSPASPMPIAPAAAQEVAATAPAPLKALPYRPRGKTDTAGYGAVMDSIKPWKNGAALEEISQAFAGAGYRGVKMVDEALLKASTADAPVDQRILRLHLLKASFLSYEGETAKAAQVLAQARALVQSNDKLAEEALFTVIYLQGVNALRQGENDNCVMCRGESSCILPISKAAMHANPAGSRQAIAHFTQYLSRFPDDVEVRWLLNVAHMTLGEYPDKVDPAHRIVMDKFLNSEFDIGRFRDVGERAKVNRLNQAGGAIMDDFDNDGLLDLVTTTFDATQPMAVYRNLGNGTFEERAASAKVTDQLGGLNCVQADYNNDGHLDIFVSRGAWLRAPIRQSLLRNNGDGTFTDVTTEAGIIYLANSNSASWGDYDNDGHLDLYVCGEQSRNLLYRNNGNGTFEEVATRAGVAGRPELFCKGANWIDIDNDGDVDLFTNNLGGPARLYRNNGDGTFADVSSEMGITGPIGGFSCWAFDYDNDGWLDIFATCYNRTVGDIVQGLMGQPHQLKSNKLFRNLQGKGFADVTREAGLDMVFATMGSNFADLDNDGFLDMYLATGDPDLGTLVPNRMFRNVAGKRFAEITSSSGTGHLQKGHGVAIGDYDRDGDVDLFVETGGAINGDRYHNILFENPGQGHHWLTVKLIGAKSNRSALGARIKIVTAGPDPITLHRHITSGSSFGANPLEQTIGLGKAQRIALLEVHWPTSKTTQTFRDLQIDQAIEITEQAQEIRKLERRATAGRK